MARNRRIATLWIAIIIVMAAVGRCLFIHDMEYKYDEQVTVQTISRLSWDQWTPLAPVSDHSGIAHSSGFFYLVRALTLGSDPLSIAHTIILINVLSIVLPLWWLRRTEVAELYFALCATSMTLILGSRKIWVPDLQAPWICLGIAGAIAGASRHSRTGLPLAALGSFCLVMSGHMYLPGAFVAAIAGVAGSVAYAVSRRWKQLVGWLVGGLLGCATFIPWLHAMLLNSPGARGESHGETAALSFDAWWSAMRMGMTVHTPYDVYQLYLEPHKEWMQEHGSSLWMFAARCSIKLAYAAGFILLVGAAYRIIRNWRETLRDPLLLSGCCVLIAIPLALFFSKLGTYIHYWLPAVPLVYYLLAWAATRGAVVWRWLTIFTCCMSWLAAVSFLMLVHDNHGLPGEYGESYSAQDH